MTSSVLIANLLPSTTPLVSEWFSFAVVVGIFSGLMAFYKKHNCHKYGCPRLSWHPDGTGHPVCKHHHKDHPKHSRIQHWLETRNKKYVRSDGGRAAAGFKGEPGDCVVRAIAIAADLPYANVREALEAMAYTQSRTSVEFGTNKKVYDPLLTSMGWTWHGTDRKTYLKDIPKGRVICRLGTHLVAVIDKVPHDTHPALTPETDILSYYTPPCNVHDSVLCFKP